MGQFVISGVNIFQGGMLSVYKDCLNALLSVKLHKDYKVVAFVHKKELFPDYGDAIELIELPDSRKSYFRRFYYEYHYFNKYSKANDVAIWLSIHDMTPNVKADKIFTYCHNPTPFFKADKLIFRHSKTVFFMSKFYKYIYRINIKKNNAVIVQQEWMRQAFYQMFPIKNIIVARPDLQIEKPIITEKTEHDKKQLYKFVFASYPRPFKNFEVICEAAQILENRKCNNFLVYLTIDGSENSYSAYLKEKYQHVKSIKWLGILPRDTVFQYYDLSDTVIFPSKLETWGMPITECKLFHKIMLLADLPYAHETVGTYDKVSFFQPDNAEELADQMEQCIQHQLICEAAYEKEAPEPKADNWQQLLDLMIKF